MKRRKRFKVAISRQYFPQSIWPKDNYFAYQVIEVMAYDRRNAAEVVWKIYGERWLKAMFTHPLDVKLYVATKKPLQSLRGLQPIVVYERKVS